MVNDPDYIRIKYLRYADDWVVGICGSQALAEDIKREIKHFLGEKLKLTLSEEKTHITNARSEEAFFLGTTLKIGHGGEAKVKLQTYPTRLHLQTTYYRLANSHECPTATDS